MLQPIIELKQLTKAYGNQLAVNNLDLSVFPGEIFGLLGPNGAGKTTTILMMLGLAEPTSGAAKVCGLDAARNPLQVKRRVGYMPDDLGFYEDRTAIENLVFTARLNRIPEQAAREKAFELLERVGLANAAGKKVGAFSRGMRQRLGLADVLIKQPEVIILDEPTLGIDPEGVRELLTLISDLSRRERLTVLLSSHHLHQVQQICHRVGLFVGGRLIACGNLSELAEQLNEEDGVKVELELQGWDESAAGRLRELDSVISLETFRMNDGNMSVIVRCPEESTGEIARVIVQSDLELLSLKRQKYGLDEIYHRFFEGGSGHDGYRVAKAVE